MIPARMRQASIVLPLLFLLQADRRHSSWWKDWLEEVKKPFDTAEFDLMMCFRIKTVSAATGQQAIRTAVGDKEQSWFLLITIIPLVR